MNRLRESRLPNRNLDLIPNALDKIDSYLYFRQECNNF